MTQKYYNQKVDIWSLGCVFAEMCMVIQYGDKKTTHSDGTAKMPKLSRNFLFPGESCYPLSPASTIDGADQVDPEDQLLKIFMLLGQQPNSELSFLKDAKASTYCESMMKHEKTYQRLDRKFSKVSPDMIECLKAMVTFSPENRTDAKQLLQS
jgi:serine/threonine protein kinase